jgi:hypothetical protein
MRNEGNPEDVLAKALGRAQGIVEKKSTMPNLRSRTTHRRQRIRASLIDGAIEQVE